MGRSTVVLVMSLALVAAGCGSSSDAAPTTTADRAGQAFCERVRPADLAALGVADTPVAMALDTLNTPAIAATGTRFTHVCGWGSSTTGEASVAVAVGVAVAPKTVADLRRAAEAHVPKDAAPLVAVDDVGFVTTYGRAQPQTRWIGGLFVEDHLVNVQGLIPGGASAKQPEILALLRRLAGR